MSKEMKQLWDNFNQYGIFPTDKQMNIALGSDVIESVLNKQMPTHRTIFDLELEMIDTAMNDVNHPYHKMVI